MTDLSKCEMAFLVKVLGVIFFQTRSNGNHGHCVTVTMERGGALTFTSPSHILTLFRPYVDVTFISAYNNTGSTPLVFYSISLFLFKLRQSMANIRDCANLVALATNADRCENMLESSPSVQCV